MNKLTTTPNSMLIIQLDNLEICDFASHETICFTAIITIDGIPCARVENDGQGGCHIYTPLGYPNKAKALINKARLNMLKAEAIKRDPDGFEQLDSLVYEMMEVANS